MDKSSTLKEEANLILEDKLRDSVIVLLGKKVLMKYL